MGIAKQKKAVCPAPPPDSRLSFRDGSACLASTCVAPTPGPHGQSPSSDRSYHERESWRTMRSVGTSGLAPGVADLRTCSTARKWSHAQSAEAVLLFQCARLHITPAANAVIGAVLAQEIDWELFTQLAQRHRLLPIVERHFRDSFEEAVPSEILEGWKGDCRGIALHNVTLANELVRVLQMLKAHGIGAIPYKGPALAAWLYGDLSLRTIFDLDLFVRHRDVARAGALLEGLGYREHFDDPTNCDHSEASEHHLVYVHRETDITIEIHWALAQSYFPLTLRGERLWQGLELRPFGTNQVLCHRAEDLLLILAAHAGKHHWSRLAWVTDVAELMRQHPSLDWDWLLREARRHRCRRIFLISLWLAHQLLDAPVPNAVKLEWKRDRAIAAAGRQVISAMSKPFADERIHSWSLQWSIRECLRDRVENIVRLVATPTQADREFVRLPDRLHYLYFPIRAVRLTWKYARKVVNGACHLFAVRNVG
jgi:hypothetical protein